MNNNGAGQTVWMHRLVCAFVVCKPPYCSQTPEDGVSCFEAYINLLKLESDESSYMPFEETTDI